MTGPALHEEPAPEVKYEAPAENFSRGIFQVEIPELGEPEKGKVRDCWQTTICGKPVRVLVTSDRLSAYDSKICTVPGKGQVLNLLSGYWFERIEEANIIKTHMEFIPHPNVLIAGQVDKRLRLPVELVIRRYMAKSDTTTSVYDHYVRLGEREIYGIPFPDGLRANEELPMGTIVTPTTKAEGHDKPLTDEEARVLVDGLFGDGTWDQAKKAALQVFELIQKRLAECGLIFADTKFELGIINGRLVLIDEVGTPDSSRIWRADTYLEKFKSGKSPDSFDKQIMRDWLSAHGYTGEGPIPVVDSAPIDQLSVAYAALYKMITGLEVPRPTTDPIEIRNAVLRYRNCTERAERPHFWEEQPPRG